VDSTAQKVTENNENLDNVFQVSSDFFFEDEEEIIQIDSSFYSTIRKTLTRRKHEFTTTSAYLFEAGVVQLLDNHGYLNGYQTYIIIGIFAGAILLALILVYIYWRFARRREHQKILKSHDLSMNSMMNLDSEPSRYVAYSSQTNLLGSKQKSNHRSNPEDSTTYMQTQLNSTTFNNSTMMAGQTMFSVNGTGNHSLFQKFKIIINSPSI
jgi:hypothetical protein